MLKFLRRLFGKKIYQRVPRIIRKPWGHEEIWAQTDSYVGKFLHIRAGHQLSKQYHKVKEETIYLWEGRMDLELKDQVVCMVSGDRYHIRPGVVHRMIAVSDCLVLEVSTSELEDVVRLEDSYGRK